MKKGGPYTKKDQDKRRNEVFKLHFEQGKSAVKIAEILRVNRNTVNDDIKILYRELKKEWNSYDRHSWIVKELHRLDDQRARLLEDKVEANEAQKNRIEEMLYKIDTKLLDLVTSLMEHKTPEEDEDDDADEGPQPSEKELEKVVMYLLNDHPWANPRNYYENEMLRGIVMFLKCDEKYARKIFSALFKNGLGLFMNERSTFQIGFSRSFDLLRYAYARDYITNDEMLDINKKYPD